MRHHLLLLAFALAPTPAPAEEPAASPPEAAAPAAEAAAPAAAPTPAEPVAPEATAAVAPLPGPPPPPPQEAPYPRLGIALGAGVPQAATLDLLYRPLPWLRLSAGPTWDYVGWGLHAGAVWSPVRWAVSPTLGVEAGHLFEADLNKVSSADPGLQPLLQRVEVQYVATTLGLEFGSQRGFSFALRLGLVWLEATTHGTGQLTGTGGVNGQNQAIVHVTNPLLRASAPTAQLVFQYFL
jgi:hypothetical protein